MMYCNCVLIVRVYHVSISLPCPQAVEEWRQPAELRAGREQQPHDGLLRVELPAPAGPRRCGQSLDRVSLQLHRVKAFRSKARNVPNT